MLCIRSKARGSPRHSSSNDLLVCFFIRSVAVFVETFMNDILYGAIFGVVNWDLAGSSSDSINLTISTGGMS